MKTPSRSYCLQYSKFIYNRSCGKKGFVCNTWFLFALNVANLTNSRELNRYVKESNFSYFVCIFVSLHKEIYLLFVHFSVHEVLSVGKLKTGGSLVKNFFI